MEEEEIAYRIILEKFAAIKSCAKKLCLHIKKVT